MNNWNSTDSGLLVALTSVALMCCNVPLLNLLGYESAAVMSFAVSVFIIPYLHTNGRFLNRYRIWQGLGDSPLRRYCRCVGRVWLMLLLPALVLSLNAIRIPNCDFGMGVIFWFTLPTISAALFIAFFHVFHAFFYRKAAFLTILMVLVDLFVFAWRLAMEPPIMGFSWTFGWFAGSIYDEALSYPAALAWHQGAMLSLTLILIFGLQCFWCRRSFRSVGFAGAVWGLSAMVWIGIQANAETLNIRQSSESIIDALGGRAESEHAVVYFQREAMNAEEEAQMLEDIEFRYSALQDFFEVDIVAWRGRKIEIFIYPNSQRQMN